MNRHDTEWKGLVAEIIEVSNENPAYVKRLLLELYGYDLDNKYETRSMTRIVQTELSEPEIIGLAAYLRLHKGRLAKLTPADAVEDAPLVADKVEGIKQADVPSESWFQSFLRHPLTGPGPIALTVTIVGTVVAGLILAYVFGIGK